MFLLIPEESGIIHLHIVTTQILHMHITLKFMEIIQELIMAGTIHMEVRD